MRTRYISKPSSCIDSNTHLMVDGNSHAYRFWFTEGQWWLALGKHVVGSADHAGFIR